MANGLGAGGGAGILWLLWLLWLFCCFAAGGEEDEEGFVIMYQIFLSGAMRVRLPKSSRRIQKSIVYIVHKLVVPAPCRIHAKT
jgi:hypothetical protein